jgi:putative transposase
MKANGTRFPLSSMAEALEISRSGYYEGISAPTGVRAQQNSQLSSAVLRIHKKSRCTYGSPRILDELLSEGWKCGKNRVARLMRKEGIVGKCPRRKRVVTTQSNHAHSASPNLIKELIAQGPDEIWVMDITYIRIRHAGKSGTHQWVYLAAVLDVFSRKIVGWHIGSTLEATLVIKALENALATRNWQPGLICHSDRGVQYACGDFRALLKHHGIKQSMSAKANCYDNAIMESFFGTLKTEEVESTCYVDLAEARRALFDYIEVFYNRTRLHTSLQGARAQIHSSAPSSSGEMPCFACSPEQLELAHHSNLSSSSPAHDTRLSALEFSKASDAPPVNVVANIPDSENASEPSNELQGGQPAEVTTPADCHDRRSHHPEYSSEGCSPAEPSFASSRQHNEDRQKPLAQ